MIDKMGEKIVAVKKKKRTGAKQGKGLGDLHCKEGIKNNIRTRAAMTAKKG